MNAETEWWAPPKREDGTVDIVQTARDLATYVREVGGYLVDATAIIEEIRPQLPPRGPLTELCEDLFAVLKFVEAKWAYADDALLSTAILAEIEGRE